MRDHRYFVGGSAKAIRTSDNDIYVFAHNAHTIYGHVGYHKFVDLDTEQQQVITDFIALMLNADNCYVYSNVRMDEVLAELDAEGITYSEPKYLLHMSHFID